MSSYAVKGIQTLKAGAAISRGMAVKKGADDDHVVKGAANTDKVFGLAQNSPSAAEQLVEVASSGQYPGLLGETVVQGDHLVCHTDGSLVKPNALGDRVIGTAMKDGDAGDIIPVEIHISMAAAAVA